MKAPDFSIDRNNKTITVTCEFDAPSPTVWEYWTTAEKLDRWWGPKPWKAQTRSMDFRKGGKWVYAMAGPEGQRQWSLAEFTDVRDGKEFSAIDAFTDEAGRIDPDFPRAHWHVVFSASGSATRVTCTLGFDSAEGLDKLVDTGFEEGFRTGLSQLGALLEGS